MLGTNGAEQFEYAKVIPAEELEKVAQKIKDLFTVIEENKAMMSDVGGIDMNDLAITRADEQKRIQFDPTVMLKYSTMNPDTFAPVIINIVPVPSLLPLLGLEETVPNVYKVSQAK